MPQTQPYIVIYSQYQQYEVGNKYHADGLDTLSGNAENIRALQATLQSSSVKHTRWEIYTRYDVKLTEGSFVNKAGNQPGEMLPFKYCAHIRLLGVGDVARPSYKMIHGIVEAFTDNGEPSAAFRSNVESYGTGLKNIGITPSDGGSLNGAVFRNFSRRRRIRRIP